MPELRLAVAERPDQGDVLRRVRQVILAADDVGDLHRLVVDHDHEVVERHPVAADDHEVAEQRVVELDLAADQVVEADVLRRDLEADDRRATLGLEGGALRIGQAQAAAVVARRLLVALLLVANRVELLGRAPAAVGRARPRGAGPPRARTAPCAGSGGTGAYGPMSSPPATCGPSSQADAEPVQVVDDVALATRRCRARRRCPRCAGRTCRRRAGRQVVVEARARRPDVQRAGGAGRHPHAHRAIHSTMLAGRPRGYASPPARPIIASSHRRTRAW